MDYLDGLNDAQKEAVLTIEGPLLVLAGAGAGKTRVIAHRILGIVRAGTAPEKILAITFTNKSASEMRTRVLKLLSEDTHLSRPAFEPFKPPFVSTFHSLGLAIIRENIKELGFKRTPTIYDRSDSLREIKGALKNLGVEDIEPRTVLGVLSRQKGQGITASEYVDTIENPRDRLIAQAWLMYEEGLRKDNALDFDDLLLRAMRLLRDNEEVRTRYQNRWKYIHIDEYQDTNSVQAQMVELLVGEEMNLCAVGDVDQSIYGWRGAQIANVLLFDKKFVGARVVMLEENYRSTKTILTAANDIISKNVFRPEKNMHTKNADGDPISVYQAFDETDEAGFIARKIKEMLADVEESSRSKGLVSRGEEIRGPSSTSAPQPRDFAVLYRANFQSRAIEEQLLAANIPHQVLGTRFFERKEVKDVMAFIHAALLPDSMGAHLARIANVPVRGIGKVTLLKMLSGKEHELTGAMREKVGGLRAILSRIRETSETAMPSVLVRFVIMDSGLERSCREDKIDGSERLQNLKELTSLAARFDTLPQGEALDAFLESAALQSDQDELKEDSNAVRLMTVHASKGLEFPYVFVTGLEEGLFPFEREGNDASDKEEERRLCYVAITRAEKRVFLTYASYRTVFGSKNATNPSQFLSDISPDLIEFESPERIGKTIYL